MKLCRCKEIKQIRVEADFGADALWCDRCLYNLDVEEFPLSTELKRALQVWIADYGKWIDQKNQSIVSNGIELEQQHNILGLQLTEQVMLALDGQYKVVFKPSIFARKYSE